MEFVLNATKRDETGTLAVTKMKRKGFVPINIYGPDSENVNAYVKSDELESLKAKVSESSLINVKVEGDDHHVIIKDVQYDPIHGKIIHVDFYEFQKGHKLKMTIPLEFVGVPKGKEVGGKEEIFVRDVEIETLPKYIVDKIEVDISDLDVKDSLRLKDVKLPPESTLLDDPERVIVEIVGAAPVEEETEEEESSEEGESEE
jgi:large subunit ribosomal protein L25